MTKSRTRPYHHGDLAAALLEAARLVVTESGWEAVSLRGVARSVGVSANASYRHFPDKAALLHAVAEAGFRALAVRMLAVQAESKGKGRTAAVAHFKATGQAYFGYALDNPEMFRLMFGPLGRDHSEHDPEQTTPYTILGEALDGLVDAGVCSPSAREGAELLAWTAVHGLSTLALGGAVQHCHDHDDPLEQVLTFLVHGLAAGS